MAKIVDYVRQGTSLPPSLPPILFSCPTLPPSLPPAGHNVVLLANHQTEPDPYILRSAFKRLVPADDPLLDRLVFVAGAKVRTDLFTIPFSKGLNLICRWKGGGREGGREGERKGGREDAPSWRPGSLVS